jgi:hypothetical protein
VEAAGNTRSVVLLGQFLATRKTNDTVSFALIGKRNRWNERQEHQHSRSSQVNMGSENMTDQEAINHHLYVEGRGEALITEGKIAGPPAISARGIAEYDELLASGFRPKRAVVREILKRYHGVGPAELDRMTDLVMG